MPRQLSAQATRIALLLAAACAVVACAKQKASTGLPNDDVVVAKVNGTNVTRYEIDQINKHSLGRFVAAAGNDNFAKLRDAAVSSRAIALAGEAELSPMEKQVLAKQVAAYREQLLVRHYLSKHAPPQAVTPELVRQYYHDHPDRFGAGKERSFELLGTTRALTGKERDRFLEAIKGVEGELDWQALAAKLQQQGMPATLTTTTSSDQMLDTRVREAMRQLQPGRPSGALFVDGRVFVARVKGEVTTPPRPFEEVSAEIERLLTPAQISDAIESVSKQVLAGSKVELMDSRKKEAKP